jgi:hypothetical protein
MGMMSARTSSPVLLTRLLIVVTFVWPTTATTTTATAGHSAFVIATASSVIGPLAAPLRSRGFHFCLSRKIVRVVFPGLHRIIDARAEIVLV